MVDKSRMYKVVSASTPQELEDKINSLLAEYRVVHFSGGPDGLFCILSK
jgi:hypothetical protein